MADLRSHNLMQTLELETFISSFLVNRMKT